MYKDGLARFATCPYQKPHESNLDNLYMHLTNYAINKKNPNFFYNFNENITNIGHKRSFSSILELF